MQSSKSISLIQVTLHRLSKWYLGMWCVCIYEYAYLHMHLTTVIAKEGYEFEKARRSIWETLERGG